MWLSLWLLYGSNRSAVEDIGNWDSLDIVVGNFDFRNRNRNSDGQTWGWGCTSCLGLAAGSRSRSVVSETGNIV